MKFIFTSLKYYSGHYHVDKNIKNHLILRFVILNCTYNGIIKMYTFRIRSINLKKVVKIINIKKIN